VRAAPDSPTPVVRANDWPTNGDLIADVARIHLDVDDLTLDATHGRGVWWQRWRPARLVTNDAHVPGADVAADFRRLPFAAGTFDVVAYDPPYCAQGGRKTSTVPDYNARYGRPSAPMSAAGTQQLVCDGLTEVARVVRPRGVLLVKCADYVWSGSYWPGTHHTLCHALDLGLELVDRFEHIGPLGPQPPRARQLHARRNVSTLFVLRAPARANCVQVRSWR
jgi:hypothetical protein